MPVEMVLLAGRPTRKVRVRGDCSGCGSDVDVVFETTFPPLIRMAEAMRDGKAPIRCDRCVDAEEEERELKEELERERERIRRRRESAGIPEGYWTASAESLERDGDRAEAIDAAIAWARAEEGSPNGVFLYGDVGRGKTWIAAAAANERLLRGGEVRWLSVAKLLSELKLPFDHEGYRRAAELLSKRPYGPGAALFLDDLDKVEPTDRTISPIFVAVDGWIAAGAQLFVTANRDLDAIAEEFGDRFGNPLASRIVGACLDVKVGGRDRRVEP